jgi:hypothetical protein
VCAEAIARILVLDKINEADLELILPVLDECFKSTDKVLLDHMFTMIGVFVSKSKDGPNAEMWKLFIRLQTFCETDLGKNYIEKACKIMRNFIIRDPTTFESEIKEEDPTTYHQVTYDFAEKFLMHSNTISTITSAYDKMHVLSVITCALETVDSSEFILDIMHIMT